MTTIQFERRARKIPLAKSAALAILFSVQMSALSAAAQSHQDSANFESQEAKNQGTGGDLLPRDFR